MKLQEVIDDLAHQLDWRGPTGKAQGVLTLNRADAAVLVREVCHLKVEAAKIVAFDPNCGCPCCNINASRFANRRKTRNPYGEGDPAEIDGT